MDPVTVGQEIQSSFSNFLEENQKDSVKSYVSLNYNLTESFSRPWLDLPESFIDINTSDILQATHTTTTEDGVIQFVV